MGPIWWRLGEQLHAVCGVLHEGDLLLWQGLGKQQLLGPVLGGPLPRFLGGLVGPPGHITCDGLVHLGGSLGELVLGVDLMVSCGLRAAAPGLWLDGCLHGGLDPDLLWQRLGEQQSVGVLGGGAGDSQQFHTVCQGCVEGAFGGAAGGCLSALCTMRRANAG
jgi:hypothetical protein